MDLEQILNALVSQSDIVLYVLTALGTLVVLGTVYVKLTPTKKDDEQLSKLESSPVLGTILKILVKFSPISRKVLDEEKKD
jgi:hypothetical protein